MKFLYGFFLFSIIFQLQSCCTKMYCPGIEDIYQIDLVGFEIGNVSSVYLVQQNTGDTLATQLYPHQDSLMIIELNSNLNTDFFYTLYVSPLNTSYVIGNFQSKKGKCNTGFMCRDFIYRLESYDVNGITYNSGFKVSVFK